MRLANIERQVEIQKNLLKELETQLTMKKQSHIRELERDKQSIQKFKTEQSKLQRDYVRQREIKNREIMEAENQLREYEINHDFAVEQQKQTIAELESKLRGIQVTRSLGVAVRSAEPVGPRKALILALSGMLGLMGGILLAFMAEFMVKVRQQQKK